MVNVFGCVWILATFGFVQQKIKRIKTAFYSWRCASCKNEKFIQLYA